MENTPLMNMTKFPNMKDREAFPDNGNGIPSIYCSQLSCTDPQTSLYKSLINGDLTTFSSILADDSAIASDSEYLENKSRLLPKDHWINSRYFEDEKNLLHIALENPGREKFVEKLIDSGADANHFNYELDLSLLHAAILAENEKGVNSLLQNSWNKADVRAVTQPEGSNPLHLAARHPKILERLLKEPKSKVNAKDSCGGRTPLYLAVKAQNEESVRLLIQHGADTDEVIEGTLLRNLIEGSFRHLDIDKIKVIRDSKRYTLDYLNERLDKRDLTVFKSVLAFIDSNEVETGVIQGGLTIMQKAAIEGLDQYVEVLLSYGVNPNVTTSEVPNPPILLAASRGNYKVLDALVSEKLPSSRSMLGVWTKDTDETILHVILKRTLKMKSEVDYKKCLSILTESSDTRDRLRHIINKKDHLGNTPLHYASKFWSQDVVAQLLKLGANIAVRNFRGEVPLSRIQPETLESFLDGHCVQTKHDPDDFPDNFEVTYKYDFLAPPVTEEQLQEWDEEKQSELAKEALPETDALWYLARSKYHRHLIKHPVLTSFMWLKWQRIRKLFNQNLRFYIFFGVILTWYIFSRFGGTQLHLRDSEKEFCSNLQVDEFHYGFFYIVFLLHCIVQLGFIFSDWRKDLKSGGLSSCIFGTWMDLFMILMFGVILYGSLGILKWILVILLVFMSIRETFQMVSSFKRYIRSVENWMEVILISIVFVLIFGPIDSGCQWHRHLGAIALLISWAELITLVGRHPKLARYNIYVTMFYKVLESFFFFLIWFSFFILAFAFGFYIMLHKDTGETPIDADYVFFDSPWLSVTKTFTMFIGEIEFSDIPISLENSSMGTPLVAYCFLLSFVFFIVVVLMNLLNGLAISDTSIIQAKAEIVSHITRVESISYAESVLLGDPFDFLSTSGNTRCWKTLPSCAPLKWVYFTFPFLQNAFQKVTGTSGLLLFFSLLSDKSAVFPSIAQEVIGRKTSYELDEMIEKTKDIIRKRRSTQSQGPCLQELIKVQSAMIEQLQKQQNELLTLYKDLKNSQPNKY